MSAVIRIKVELALTAASGKLLCRSTDSAPAPTPPTPHSGTVTAVRKELEKLVQILADDASEKHFNVAARVATCAGYLAQIPSPDVQDALTLMVGAHRVLLDTMKIAL